MRQENVPLAMTLMISAMLILPVMDAIAKILSTWYGVTPAQITFGRFTVQTIFFVPIVIFYCGLNGLVTQHFWLNFLRGSLIGGAVLLFFTAIRTMPLADAIAIFFTEPFILTILSVIFLRETIGFRRILAMVVGFLGALFIIQPSYALFGAVSLLPLGTAVLFSLYLLLTRILSANDNPLVMQYSSGLGGATTLLIVMLIFNQTDYADTFGSPDIPDFGIRWTLLLGLGLLAAVGHLVVVIAFKFSDASILAPFQYIEIISATFFGYWLFGDFPDSLKWTGIVLIIGSGIYLFVRGKR